ncbi:MAG TPA: primosomal protein N' [Gammaproteobacteria bacterium]|nr:primosomal protein N' [Gammaproteobacteria bacterium]
MPKDRIIKVAVPCPLYRTFDYRLPETVFNQAVEAGMRVRVPFGRQKLIGFILEEHRQSELPEDKLRAITTVLDPQSLISHEIMELVRWAARYYVHPLGDALQTALPVYLRSNEDASAPQIRSWHLPEQAATAASIEETRDDTLEKTLATLKRAPRQAEVYRLLAKAPHGLNEQALNERCDNWRPAVRALLQKKLITQQYRPVVLEPLTEKSQPPPLNPEQTDAIEAIARQQDEHAVHVLSGITGSGKTEVYLALCEKVLAQGRQVLILVPEIGLTPQLTQRFRQRLDAPLVVLHSGMSDRERYAAWHAAASGQARLLIGTRSSIFTPMPEPGLIIVDEEHDGSYKQQDGFRYNARDLAIVRARNNQIPVLLGSATPSLETLNNINEQRYQVHHLRQRANKKPLPKIRLLNLCSLQLYEGMASSLLDRIRIHLKQQGQVLLFINRRGFSPLLMCHDCGWSSQCQRCDAHMTYHKRHNELRCHHCGAQRPAPQNCENCGSDSVLAIGAGTERIEQFLQQYFPDTRVSRIDRDSTRAKGSLQEKLEQAHSGESGILVGTQMLAKGHDFPNLTLVCILDTDQALFSADFRAAEHLAQLITQVSGRAGRAEKPGEVLIQTHHPEHPLLQLLLHEGYEAFARAALEERKTAGLPPARHLALLRCESVDTQAAQAFLQQVVDLAETIEHPDIDLFGPLPAPMERRAGRYRYQLMLQSDQRKKLHPFLSWLAPQLQQMKSARKVRWSLDVDPYDTF